MNLDWGKSDGKGGGWNGSLSGGRETLNCLEKDSMAVTKEREESITRGLEMEDSEAINERHWKKALELVMGL